MLYIALFIWSMVGMNVVLTLPGIAALILSVGMGSYTAARVISVAKQKNSEVAKQNA